LAAGAAAVLGCGEADEACFDGPAVTVTAEIQDILSWDEPLEGIEGCVVMDDRPCGCARSDAQGWIEMSVPAGREFVLRFAADGYVSVYVAAGPLHVGFHSLWRMLSRQLAQALALIVGQTLDPERGAVTVEAAPAPGFVLEGCTAELLDATGMPVTEGSGPYYVNGSTNQPDPLATAGVGERLFVVWLNVPPGTYLGRARTPSGDNLYDRCSGTVDSGWVRNLDGETVLETLVFPDAGSQMMRRDCEP
jgi:hypothetical protein